MLQNDQKSTRNVRLSLILITTLILSGCSLIPGGRDLDLAEVQTIEAPREPLAIEPPDPVDMDPVEWIVITPDNADEVFEDLKSSGKEVVLIGLTPDGYEVLSLNSAEMRSHINIQRVILEKYQEYYEGSDSNPSPESDRE